VQSNYCLNQVNPYAQDLEDALLKKQSSVEYNSQKEAGVATANGGRDMTTHAGAFSE